MSSPAVTVVIACFNYAHYLPESVGSVLAQTLTDFELLIIDDGSTDDSLAVAHRLAEGDERITVIAQPNAGQPAIPRNVAIRHARGRHVVSLDADDRLGPTALERCAATLDADPRTGLAYAQEQNFGSIDTLHPHLDFSVERLRRFNYLPSATMFRRDAWEAAGGYNTNVRGYEDWDLWLGIAEAGYWGAPAHGALWYYRKHGGGVYSEAKGGDQLLKAQVVVNRSGVFGDGVLGWARGVLAGDPAALAIPQRPAIVPEVPDAPRPLTVATHRAERADWYVASLDALEGPWPARSLRESLAAVDALGYTSVHAGGAEVARKRGSDPLVFPVPFFSGDATDSERAAALAGALEDVLLGHALRAPQGVDATRTAAYIGVPASSLQGLADRAQALMRTPAPVPVADAEPLAKMARVLRSERALTGDRDGADRAKVLERAAARAGLEQARGLAILAFGDELVADPSLLAAYGAAFSGEDDATLVIVTTDPAPLLDAVAAAGLDGEGSADLLAVDTAPPGVDAVLSRSDRGGLPRFDETSLAGLRGLVPA